MNASSHSNSTPRSDDPDRATSHTTQSGTTTTSGATASAEKYYYYSPLTSPPKTAAATSLGDNHLNTIHNFIRAASSPAREEADGVVGKERSKGGVRVVDDDEVVVEEEEEEMVERSRREQVLMRARLGFRVCEFVLCLISFSIMAADETPGWSGDSFDRHFEYRYCLSVNVIAFVYSGFQAVDLAYHLATGKHVVTHHLRRQFDFVLDQVLAYFLISSSSAAATTIVDWELDFGKDEFTKKASVSVTMSFLAFIAFAISSLISGYDICSHEFT